MNAKRPRVAVACNEPVLPADHPDALSESDVLNMANAVAAALDSRGFDAEIVQAGAPIESFLARLTAFEPDLVFNLVEGFDGDSRLATHVTALFELMGLPYTGAPVETLAACVSKARTKALLRGLGLPTACSIVVLPDGPMPASGFSLPAMVKPDAEDGSLGIDQGSVVTTIEALLARIEHLRERHGGSVLVEDYLPGPEYNVGVAALPEPRSLPVAWMRFTNEGGEWPILTYAGKWVEGSPDDFASLAVCPAPIGEDLAASIQRLAVAAFVATGCRDYARVDIRLDHSGSPMILEVNPNPDISPDIGWARAAKADGLSYADAIAAIAGCALARGARRQARVT